MAVKISPNAPCPCHGGAKYKKCCGRWHGGRPAPTPTALMRSRFRAYALHRVDYILETTHPESPHRQAVDQRAAVERFCRATTFGGLEIFGASADGDRGEVSFHASLSQGERDASFGERSLFHRVGGRWLYHSGVSLPKG